MSSHDNTLLLSGAIYGKNPILPNFLCAKNEISRTFIFFHTQENPIDMLKKVRTCGISTKTHGKSPLLVSNRLKTSFLQTSADFIVLPTIFHRSGRREEYFSTKMALYIRYKRWQFCSFLKGGNQTLLDKKRESVPKLHSRHTLSLCYGFSMQRATGRRYFTTTFSTYDLSSTTIITA